MGSLNSCQGSVSCPTSEYCNVLMNYKCTSFSFGSIDQGVVDVNEELTGIKKDINATESCKYNICDINPKYITFGTHHKTGTRLFKGFVRDFQWFYDMKCPQNMFRQMLDKISHTRGEIGMISTLHPTYRLSRNYDKVYRDKTGDNIKVLFHAIRDPINMILSGYNFHKLVSKEKNTHSLTIKDLYQQRRSSKITKGYFDCYSKLFYDNDQNNILYETYMRNNSKYYDFPIEYLLKNVFDTEHGLIWEYERFVCLEGREMLETFNDINEINDPQHNIFAENLSLEQFEMNYNETCHKMLNILGICDQFDIDTIMNKLSEHNLNIQKKSPQRAREIKNHATKGLYDKESQIELLLNDKNRCLFLKNMTDALGLLWRFNKC